MRALKILVVVMGIVLVVGFIVLVAVIAQRIVHRAASPSSPPPVSAPVSAHPAPLSNFQPKDIDIPAGAKLLAAAPSGDQVLLRLALPDGSEELMLVDWQGQRIAALHVHATVPADNPKP